MKQQYFLLNKKYHPDFFGNGTDEEKEEALQMSSLVNKAYKIFNNQAETIKYVLQLKGLLQEDEKFALPNTFLMEMMELNEELMDAKMNDNQLSINNCKLTIDSLQAEIYNDLKYIIEAESLDRIEENELQKVKEYYFKKKYLNRILDSIK